MATDKTIDQLAGIVRNQEIAIQMAKRLLPQWAKTLSESRNDLSTEVFEDTIAEMHRVANSL